MSTSNAPASYSAPSRRTERVSFSTQIVIGLGLGTITGLLLGELAAPIKVVADGFVKLMQMTVLPYVTISIITSLGALSPAEARRTGWRVGLVLVGFWGVALAFVGLFPLAFPKIETASFFSTTLIERRPPFNFVDLYIPSNPFHSLANNVVPAVVLFSVIIGVALIGVEKKQVLLEVLDVANRAVSRATRLIMRLTPFGLFAIAANIAGTLSVEQIKRIEIYLVVYTAMALLLALWVLPGLVAAFTPLRGREILGVSRNALITAAVAGDLFIVLPVLIESSKELLERHNVTGEHSRDLPDVVVPASFNLPHSGKILSISFILFAGWYSGADISLSDYPRLALTGLLTFFGSLNVAVPYLLDLFKIPADTFQLFLATGVINSRFGALIAAVHTLCVGLLGSAAIAGAIEFRASRILRFAVTTLVLCGLTIGGLRALFNSAMKPQFQGAELVYGMRPLSPHSAARVVDRRPEPGSASAGVLESIRVRKALRVGFLEGRLPYIFRNREGVLVGLDVELAQMLADDLGVDTEFILFHREEVLEAVSRGECDIVMSGMPVTPNRASQALFSQPYLDETLGFVVLDHLREDYSSWNSIRALGPVRIWSLNVPYYVSELRRRLPEAKLEQIREEEYQNGSFPDHDVMVLPAERGSVYTLLYPKYSVVVPEPDLIKIPLAYPLARHDQNWSSYVNTWLELKKRDGTINALYRHWILGQSAERHAHRWSLIRDVLHWVD